MLSKYHVAVKLERGLSALELADLQAGRSDSIASYETEGEDVVVCLYAPTLLTATDTAEIQVQRATGLVVMSTQLLA